MPESPPFRVLVTGSRDWADEAAVRRELSRLWLAQGRGRLFVVVHGACPTGADHAAAQWVADWPKTGFGGVAEEPHPADWRTHGKAAGPLRNQAMVTRGANACLAFIRDHSRGASHTARLAEQAGIPTRRWTA